MKFVLILMIKNEEKILKRCLEAVASIVDCFCICDTGSTDNTVKIANEFLETHTGCLSVVPWKNFGYNRSASFDKAQSYVRNVLEWNLTDVYGLLLDADMVFIPGTLKKQVLTEPGYSLIQMNGEIEYHNCRLVRMDYPWKCVGVTHEYWDGPTKNIPKSVCYIDDRNDGGCKHDKFQRDRTLLEKGLNDEPTNGRYMFYLAQTYKCLDLYKESIKMYKKRIATGGWSEELWYSHYMIAEMYASMKNYPKFEEWMLRAHAYRPSRSEPLAKLAEHFRIVGQHYKSYHYIQLGRTIPFPDDSLFVESKVYQGKFDYEASIIEYYVSSDKKVGLRSSVRYLLKNDYLMSNVLSNIGFYVKPLNSKIKPLSISPVFGDEYHPSSISVLNYPFANVRFVNYDPPVDGEYRVKNGGCVQTHNSFMNIETGEAISTFTDDIGLPKRDSFTKGIEDIRIYKNKNESVVRYIATNYSEYSQGIHIISGIYDYSNSLFTDSKVILSPNNRECEKNWLPVEESGTFIYEWHPLQVGKIIDNEFKIAIRHNTPPIFQLFRGSTPPRVHNNTLWTLVHLTECSKPRKYYHCFVELEMNTYKPTRMTLPFVFKSVSVEYCLSFDFKDETTIRCYTSFMDSNPAIVEFGTQELEWIAV
jgi:glycosyltransferase involved in cell wall biosynthesis